MPLGTYTLLTAVNKTLGRVGVIQGVAGYLTSLTETGRQIDIDVMVSCWNEVLQDVAIQSTATPGMLDSGNVTLVNGTKEYQPPTGSTSSKSIEVVKHIVCPARRIPILDFPGGFDAMLLEQPDPTLFQGMPSRWCVSPITGAIRFDFTPTASEAGVVMAVYGAQRQYVSAATDLFPVTDTVIDGLVPAVAMKWRKERQKGDWDREEYFRAIGDAMRWAARVTPLEHWGVGRRSWR